MQLVIVIILYVWYNILYNYYIGEFNVKKKFLKATAVTLSLSMCAMLGGCFDSDTVKELITGEDKYNDIQTISADTEYEKVLLDYGYNSLETPEQKQLYTAIEGVVNAVSDEMEEELYPMKEIELKKVNLSEGNIRIVIEAFNCDHPEIFWVSNTFGYYSDEKLTMVHLYSEFSATDINHMQSQLNTEIESFLSDMPTGLSEYEREKFIHDKLLNNCKYEEDADITQGRQSAFTMYGALVEGSAVCEGYTKTMQYLLKLVGIETITVNGYSKSELHQWCLVNIDDKWYHLDATWNDIEKTEEHDAGVLYTYFNVSDPFIEVDHEVAEKYTALTEEELCGKNGSDAKLFNLPLPECSYDEAAYFTVEGANFTAFDDYECYDRIVNQLYDTALKKGSGFSIKISDELDYNDTIDKMFYNEPYEFFEYATDVNKMMDTDYKISDNLSIITHEEQHLVQIQLRYE